MKVQKVKKIVNLTPHVVRLIDDSGRVILELPAAEKPARAVVKNGKVGVIEFDRKQIPVNGQKVEGETENLPEPQKGTIFVVSLLVCRANPNRGDLFVVDELVRDKKGKIVGAKALSRNPFFKGEEQRVEDFELHFVDDFNDHLELGVGVRNGKGYLLVANEMGEFRFEITSEVAHKLAQELTHIKNYVPYKNTLDVNGEFYE